MSWENVAGSELAKWENIGDSLEGRYIDRAMVRTMNGQDGYQHIFETDTGVVKFYGTADLNDKLLTVPFGRLVLVEYAANRRMSNGFVFKVFNVAVWVADSDEDDSTEYAVTDGNGEIVSV